MRLIETSRCSMRFWIFFSKNSAFCNKTIPSNANLHASKHLQKCWFGVSDAAAHHNQLAPALKF
jgi:hypothetical protein